jgi:hypothetical protein
MYSQAKGSFKGTLHNTDGTSFPLILTDVLYVPDLWLNFFSITKAIQHDTVKLGSSHGNMTLTVGPHQLTFDQTYPTGPGRILGITMLPHCNKHVHLTATPIAIDIFHQQLGHPDFQVCKSTATSFGIHKIGSPFPCIHCALSKSKKLKIPKLTLNHATLKGQRLALDISYPNYTSSGGSKYELLIQDEFTGYVWSLFLKAKSDLPDTMISWLHQFQKDNSLTVQYIRCNNSGENVRFQRLDQEDKTLKTRFELTGPYTSEQNGMGERKYELLDGKVRAMLNWANFPESLRQLLWAQCASHAILLENILCKQKSKTASELFHGQNPPWIQHLKIFGDIGIVHDHKKIRSKLTDRGQACVFIGYSSNHASNVYKLLTINKHSMIQSRSSVWLQLSYGEYIDKHVTKRTNYDYFDLDDFDHRCLHAEYPLDVYQEIESKKTVKT